MNAVIARITIRQLLSRRRTVLLLLLGGVVVLVALALRLGVDEIYLDMYTAVVLSNLGLATLLPLVALLFGTGALGGELEDGTAIYLLAKPIGRWTVLLTKLAVAAACAVLLTCAPMLLAGLIGAGGLGDGLVVGFVVAGAIGSVIYCAIFVALSLVTSRALVFGLGYVLIWEGLLAGLFPGTRTFSVRQVASAIADALADVPADVFAAELDLATAVIVGAAILVGATVLAARRLSDLEIAGESA
ncbi:MAG: ABC transporter permease subunit [Candidatus Limnocylindria bacterium]